MIYVTFILRLLILLALSPLRDFHKILVVSPLPISSHVMIARTYVNLLLEAGHQITYITGVSSKISSPNLLEIDISKDDRIYFPMKQKREDNQDPNAFARLVTKLSRTALQHSKVSGLLKNTTQKFDLVLAEWLYNDVFNGLAALYDCPLIWYCSLETHWKTLLMLNEAINLELSVTQKTINTPKFVSSYLLKDVYLYDLEKKIYNNIFGPLMELRGKRLCPFDESKNFGTLVLIYSHLWVDYGLKFPNNFKQVAGFHINENVKPLPKNLKTIMDNAKNGVIYFSMGAYLKTKNMPGFSERNLIDMFGQLKQTVIWKFERNFSNLPSNVHILTWAPQQSILSHPNCIIFITHGGILSTTEAVHFGVPMIGIPVFGDQFENIERAVVSGFAMKLDVSIALADAVKGAIEEMLRNSRYRQRAKEVSSLYHSRPIPIRIELLYWINETIRTGIPSHLRSTMLDEHLYNTPYNNLHPAVIFVIVLSLVTIIVKRFMFVLFKIKYRKE